ncbi:MAG TPA: hypothetical protein VG826_25545 [Pirellulales bacterium]|nr:hypothetical protein [Pirellulales bacterium]
MEARLVSAAFVAAAIVSLGAGSRTPNFVVRASTAEFAKEVGQAAEKYRRELAIEWLGKEMPNWYQPCPITVEDGPRLGAGGATSFVFDHGDVFGWQMTIQGSRERILDSVLPHEVTHTIFASHFRRPLPRWADEGACSTVEHDSERRKQQRMLIQFLQTRRGIAFNDMFAMTQYPKDILPLYAQGHSLATFLVAQGGKRKFLQYVKQGLATNDWTTATQAQYQFASLGRLQTAWLDWVRCGSPLPLETAETEESNIKLVAVKTPKQPRPTGDLVYRGTDAGGGTETGGQSGSLPDDLMPGPVGTQGSRPRTVESGHTVLLEGGRPPVPATAIKRAGQSVYSSRGTP